MIDRSDRFWYRDAVVYQLHVKAFFDANNDGIGDIAGLIEKLDYVRELGVTAIWLLPFYPSPLRDDGYDIAGYRDVNRAYGSLKDFRMLLRAAHDRGLRVITELVINHTSDQHPWFQRAREAQPGSPEHDFYVWSDTDQKYADTRIIFVDAEKSNWTWDPVAKAYYWHRFYAHQPDLNFANPRVLREVLNAMHFWLAMGVDGLRLDAVPYLCEREGTSNENLPEIHAVLRRIRAEVDARYPDRMLLAEANQWPEDVQEYFGAGDECHMAFHFPLMTRMYAAIAQEDRHPITDILRQTPAIPDGCQWAIFLRNHDELTLEMVTDQERDYLWGIYASDRRMRINLGIRRRLAPLMDNDRRKIELMNALLLSMPGTPVVYYGDEIGMGDNIYLGDRDGVRTPMQWTFDRNGGFSRADPARLYLPTIQDPLYGFAAVNVESQQREVASLLNWTRRMVVVRQAQKAFGRGTLEFCYPSNRKVLAYLRRFENETILCIVNLSRSAQAAELDLSAFRGRTPVEMIGRAQFPRIGEGRYQLTLAAYGYYWFSLEETPGAAPPAESPSAMLPEFVTLVLRRGWGSLGAGGPAMQLLLGDALPTYLVKQQWLAAGAESGALTLDWSATLDGDDGILLTQVTVPAAAGPRTYFVPLARSYAPDALNTGSPFLTNTVAKVRSGPRIGPVYDALTEEQFARAAIAAIAANTTLPASTGVVRFSAGEWLARTELGQSGPVRRLTSEPHNASVVVDERAVLKLFRRLAPGVHPEIEISRYLTEVAGFTRAPAYLGSIEHEAPDGTRTALGVLKAFVAGQGDGWTWTTEYLRRTMDQAVLEPEGREAAFAANAHGGYVALLRVLARRTAEMHRALAEATEVHFAPDPMTAGEYEQLALDVRTEAEGALAALAEALPRLDDVQRDDARRLLAAGIGAIEAFVTQMVAGLPDSVRIRVHGDYHLGQVLVVRDDWYIIDFEGEPGRALAARNAKMSPLHDVATMLRSFETAAHRIGMERATLGTGDPARAMRHALAWRDVAASAFVGAYDDVAHDIPGWLASDSDRKRLLALYTLRRALFEMHYEAAHRPDWLHLPVRSVLAMLGLNTADAA